QVLHHAQQLEVRVTFQGAEWDELRPAGSMADTIAGTLQGSILNLEQAQEWRSLPAGMEGGETVLPVGSDAYRIEVNQDGIYEVTFVDLAVAGMNVSAVNPNT